MYEAWTAGDHDRARELHFALHPLVDLLFVETNPAPAKHVLHQDGLISSARVRPPLLGATAEGQAVIAELLTASDSVRRTSFKAHN
jgi:4-hydroxy-tetrahydrodipicolinate synthase